MPTASSVLRSAAQPVFALLRVWYRLRYPRLTLGKGVLFTGRLKLRRGVRVVLEDGVRIRQTVSIKGHGHVTVGRNTLLNGCWMVCASAIEVGADCLISDCGITDNDFHNLRPEERHLPATPRATAPIRIGDNVWVGLRAIILKGTTIGANSVIGAGAVVRGDIDPDVVVSGNPATVVKRF